MSHARETPLILWICAAVCAHFIFAEGGATVASFHDDRSYIYQLSSRARSITHGKDQTIDIITSEDGKPQEAEPEEPKPAPVAEKKPPEEKKPEPPKPQDQKKPEPPKQEEVKIAVKEEDPLKKLDQVPLKQDKRIAVKQHAKKNQDDNPNARFIADEANKVDDETVATQTSHDQDDPNPTPGANRPAGPKDKVGDSERTKIADSEEHKGEKDKAPGEKGTEFDVQHDNKPIDKPMGPVAINQPQPSNTMPKVGGDG